jgi:hypothetical protein
MSSINSRVPPLRLAAVDTPTDGQLPSYQASSGQFEWVDDQAGGTPGGSNNEIQFNDSGAFGGDAGFTMAVKGAGDSTAVQIGKMKIGAGGLIQNTTQNGLVFIYSEGSGQIYLTGSTDGGGTFTDQIVNIMCNTDTDTATLKLRNTSGTSKEATIDLDGNIDVNIKNLTNGKDIILTTSTTGLTRLKNSTSNTDTQLNIQGNGTGTPKINLSNDSKAVTIQCDENQKLKIIGGSDDFIFDVSSATGGITFPDGTVQTTAASGIGGSLSNTEVAVGSGTDTISGSNGLLFDGTSFTVNTLSTNDPIINMSSNTKSVSLEVNASQKLTVKGASNSFVFDASTASGGITFPDGTVQTTAASGSSGGSMLYGSPNGDWQTGNLTKQNIASNGWATSQATTTTSLSSGYQLYRPFVSAMSGDLTAMSLNVSSSSAGSAIRVGIYNADSSDGNPTSLIGYGEFDSTSTGTKTITSFSTTITLERDKLYYYAVVATSGSPVVRSMNATYSNALYLVDGYSANSWSLVDYTNTRALSNPASTSTMRGGNGSYAPINVGLKWV